MRNSKNKFAIIIDTQEKVPSLLETIKELCLVESSKQPVGIELVRPGKLLVFDKKDLWDYEIEDSCPLILDSLDDIFEGKHYKISKDFDKILNEVYLFAGKKPKKSKDMTINITISRPTKRKHKVRVFTNFVKVGWDQYSIKIDRYTGYEYVIIKGNRYEVVRDIFGKGYLVEL